MDEIGFGEILRQTRERKGLDLNATARRLRIRPDILRAIEDGNFAAMPPRGYTRNMVNGYARYLGLNPTEITGMFIEELYAYQSGISQQHRRSSGFDMSEAPDNNALFSRRFAERGSSQQSLRSYGKRAQRQGSTNNAASKSSRSDRQKRASRSERKAALADSLPSMSPRGLLRRKSNTDSQSRQALGSVLPQSAYTNHYAGGEHTLNTPRNIAPFLIAAVVLLLLAVAIWFFFFNNHAQKTTSTVETLPVTGVTQPQTDSSSTEESNAETQTTTPSPTVETAPTKATFTYSIPSGKSTYLEITVDGTKQVVGDESGPQESSFDFSDSVKLVASEKSNISVKIDGKDATLEENARGIVSTTFTFNDVLSEWQKEHPNAAVSASSSTESAQQTQDSSSTTQTSASSTTTSTSQTERAH